MNAAEEGAPRRRRRIAIGRVLLVWILSALTLWVVAELMPGVTLKSFGSAVWLIAVIALLNALVWPVLLRVALPLTVLTLGFGVLLVNGAVVWLLSELNLGLHVSTFAGAVVITLCVSLVDTAATERAGDRRRRLLVPQRGRAQRAADRAGQRTRQARTAAARDRRPRPRRAHAGAARRQRPDDGPLAARRVPPPDPLGDRLVLADGRLPGGAAARQQRGHAGLPLVGEGARCGDRHQPPPRRRRARASPLRRTRPAVRRRGQPRQHPLGRRSPQPADDEHRPAPRPPRAHRPGLLRLLRQPLQRHAHVPARDPGHVQRALARLPPAAPGRAPADPTLARVCARPRLGHRDPARPPGRLGDLGHVRGAPGDLHDLPRLRRGRPPLRDRAPRRALHARGSGPADRAAGVGGRRHSPPLRAGGALRPRPVPGGHVPRPLRDLAGGARRTAGPRRHRHGRREPERGARLPRRRPQRGGRRQQRAGPGRAADGAGQECRRRGPPRRGQGRGGAGHARTARKSFRRWS